MSTFVSLWSFFFCHLSDSLYACTFFAPFLISTITGISIAQHGTFPEMEPVDWLKGMPTSNTLSPQKVSIK